MLLAPYWEIFIVSHRRSVGWRWRLHGANGQVSESVKEYAGYFDCVSAARASGYRTRAEWTHPVTLRWQP
jgi:predicted transcriptional regulator